MTKISSLSALTGAATDTAADLIPVVDMSETGAARNKKMTFAELALALQEAFDDRMDAVLTEGDNVTITYDDGAGTITIAATPPGPGDITGFNEAVDDRVAALITAGSGITKSYNDGAGTLTLSVAGGAGGALDDLADVNAPTPSDGNVLTWDSTPGEWIASAPGGVTFATASDINTGTDTTKALNSDALAGSNFGKATITLLVSDPAGSAITTGDGKAYWPVPSTLNGMNLVAVAAYLTTVSSSGIPTVQIHNLTQTADMLTTKLTIDASELTSATAAAAAVIDTGNDDVATGDMIRIDIDVAGTGAKGLMVEMQFQLP